MKYLLDTHVFLWMIAESSKLPESFERVILNPGAELFLSVASIWEAALKNKIGKLPLPSPAADYLIRLREQHLIQPLTIDDQTIRVFQSLDEHHKDPFDHLSAR